METILRKLGQEEDMDEHSPSLQLIDSETKQYTFWDVDVNETATAPLMIGQLLADDGSLNVTIRSGHDNLVQGGAVRNGFEML